MSEGICFDIKEFTVHDGPGARVTIFFKGCPLRCLWCHNPEGIRPEPQLLITKNGCTHCGRCFLPCSHAECKPFDRCIHACPLGLVRVAGTRYTARELAERMQRLSPLLADGGVTVSGGEPLMQPGFLLELLERLRPMHTIVETSGYAEPEVFQQIAGACSMIYLDIKHGDCQRHRALTGAGNERIRANLKWLKAREKPFVARIPLIPGCNDDDENLENTAALLEGASNFCAVELLPYNPFSDAKYEMVDMTFPLGPHRKKSPEPASSRFPMEPFVRRGLPCRIL